MRRPGALIGLVLALAAVTVDAQSPAAAMWLARCASSDLPAAVSAALRIDEHVRAFPLTMAVMAWRCLWPGGRAARIGVRSTLRALGAMLLAMPLACLLAALLAAPVAPAWQPWCYGALMVTLGGLPALLTPWARPAARRTNVLGPS